MARSQSPILSMKKLPGCFIKSSACVLISSVALAVLSCKPKGNDHQDLSISSKVYITNITFPLNTKTDLLQMIKSLDEIKIEPEGAVFTAKQISAFDLLLLQLSLAAPGLNYDEPMISKDSSLFKTLDNTFNGSTAWSVLKARAERHNKIEVFAVAVFMQRIYEKDSPESIELTSKPKP